MTIVEFPAPAPLLFRGEYVAGGHRPGIEVIAQGERHGASRYIEFDFSWHEWRSEARPEQDAPIRVDVSRLQVLSTLGPGQVSAMLDAVIRWALDAVDPERLGTPVLHAIDPRCDGLLPIDRFAAALAATTRHPSA